MLKRVFVIIVMGVSFLTIVPQKVEAKRILPRWSSTALPTTAIISGKPTISVKFLPSHLGITVVVQNTGSTSSISYSLTYFSRGIEQGADGAIKLDANTVSKQLIFGSCSTNNNCRYDTQITDAKLTVTTTLKTGRRVIKPFKLKI